MIGLLLRIRLLLQFIWTKVSILFVLDVFPLEDHRDGCLGVACISGSFQDVFRDLWHMLAFDSISGLAAACRNITRK